MSDIVIKGIVKRYGDKPVLHNFSATFPEGGVSCIAGPSGAGKTTLVHILMGLERVDGGEVTGLESKRISAVFQEERFCENLSAVRNVALVMPGPLQRGRIEGELVALGLCDADFRTPVSTLSGGMRRRVALARALLAPHDVLILDEPFKGLDDAVKWQCIEHVKGCEQGKTVLLVTHDLREAEAMGASLFYIK